MNNADLGQFFQNNLWPFGGYVCQATKPQSLLKRGPRPILSMLSQTKWWQMLFDYAHVTAGQTILIHAAAGNVGAYAVQLASQAGVHVTATAASADLLYVRSLGAESTEARWDSRLCHVTRFRHSTKTLWPSSGVLLCGRNDIAA